MFIGQAQAVGLFLLAPGLFLGGAALRELRQAPFLFFALALRLFPALAQIGQFALACFLGAPAFLFNPPTGLFALALAFEFALAFRLLRGPAFGQLALATLDLALAFLLGITGVTSLLLGALAARLLGLLLPLLLSGLLLRRLFLRALVGAPSLHHRSPIDQGHAHWWIGPFEPRPVPGTDHQQQAEHQVHRQSQPQRDQTIKKCLPATF